MSTFIGRFQNYYAYYTSMYQVPFGGVQTIANRILSSMALHYFTKLGIALAISVAYNYNSTLQRYARQRSTIGSLQRRTLPTLTLYTTQ